MTQAISTIASRSCLAIAFCTTKTKKAGSLQDEASQPLLGASRPSKLEARRVNTS